MTNTNTHANCTHEWDGETLACTKCGMDLVEHMTPTPKALVTHATECLEVIKTKCLGRLSHFDRGAPISIEGLHSTGTGTAGYFTDPHDGRRYRITVEAVIAHTETLETSGRV